METTALKNDYFIVTKIVTKKQDGIKYYSEKVTNDGYRFWESNTHPSYSHFTKIKNKN